MSYLHDLDVTGREPSRYSILLSFPPSSGQRARDADQLPGLEVQAALVLLAAERVQTPAQRSRHRKLTSPALTQTLSLLSNRERRFGSFLPCMFYHLPAYRCCVVFCFFLTEERKLHLNAAGLRADVFLWQHARIKPKTRSLLDI